MLVQNEYHQLEATIKPLCGMKDHPKYYLAIYKRLAFRGMVLSLNIDTNVK